MRHAILYINVKKVGCGDGNEKPSTGSFCTLLAAYLVKSSKKYCLDQCWNTCVLLCHQCLVWTKTREYNENWHCGLLGRSPARVRADSLPKAARAFSKFVSTKSTCGAFPTEPLKTWNHVACSSLAWILMWALTHNGMRWHGRCAQAQWNLSWLSNTECLELVLGWVPWSHRPPLL